MKAVLDTNVYISALIAPGGVSADVVDLGRHGKITLFISRPVLREIEGVLRSPKFRWSRERVRAAVRQIRGFAETVTPAERLAVVKEDEDDNRILECAVAANVQFVVSGGQPPAQTPALPGCIAILSPAQFLAVVGGS